MYIRCPSCKTARHLKPGDGETKTRCSGCGRVWSTNRLSELDETPREPADRADASAREHPIDPTPVDFVATPARPVGLRSSLARLAPIGVGLVVGGIVSVLGARILGDATATAPREARLEAPSAQTEHVATEPSRMRFPPQVLEPPEFEATVVTDESGQLTRINGRTPRSVLEAYCAAAGMENPREPWSIAAADPPRPGVKIGLLERRFDPGLRFAIWIRRDENSGEWFAGNGVKPLEDKLYSQGAGEWVRTNRPAKKTDW